MKHEARQIQSMQVGDCCVSVSTRDVLLLAYVWIYVVYVWYEIGILRVPLVDRS